MISEKDKVVLRELAHKQLEIANSELNLCRVSEWKKHNALKGTRPMIHIELDTFEQEVIPQRLLCEGRLPRLLERDLQHAIINLSEFNDDKVVPNYFGITLRNYFNPFGHVVSLQTATDKNGNKSLGHQFEHWITDLEDDWQKLQKSTFGIDMAATNEYKKAAEEAFGNILPVKLDGACLYAVPTQQIVHLMSMESMFFAMYDYPELFKQLMDKISNDYVDYFKLMETMGFLLPTTDFQNVGQGSLAFTEELKKDGKIRTNDVWGFLDSQETVGISKEMFNEFIFPYYNKIAQYYGLLSYGCCEPVDVFWDKIKTLPNLRKVSISPWCNQEFMADELRDSEMIFHRKPSPNYLGIGAKLDENAFRAHIKETITTARGCKLEITQRDVYTISHDIGKVRRYVEIIREEIANNWV